MGSPLTRFLAALIIAIMGATVVTIWSRLMGPVNLAPGGITGWFVLVISFAVLVGVIVAVFFGLLKVANRLSKPA